MTSSSLLGNQFYVARSVIYFDSNITNKKNKIHVVSKYSDFFDNLDSILEFQAKWKKF